MRRSAAIVRDGAASVKAGEEIRRSSSRRRGFLTVFQAPVFRNGSVAGSAGAR
jgi:hypothetical protein